MRPCGARGLILVPLPCYTVKGLYGPPMCLIRRATAVDLIGELWCVPLWGARGVSCGIGDVPYIGPYWGAKRGNCPIMFPYIGPQA